MKRLFALALLVLVVAGGCGSTTRPRAQQPKLPALVAEQLAARSDKVAEALDRGDSCTALDEARRLQRDTVAAINAGRVPGPYQEQLGSSVADLVERITCVPPAPPPEEQKKHEHGKRKHKGKHGEGD